MTNTAPRRAILLLGMPGAGVEAAARSLAAADVGIVPDVAPIERLAARIATQLGVSARDPGPLALPGRTVAASVAAIDAHLDATFGARAMALLAAATGEHTTALLPVQEMLLAPRFWLAAASNAGVSAQVVLVDRSPLALDAPGSKQSVRRGMFAWHFLTLRLLDAAPDAIVVPARDILAGAPIDPALGIGRWLGEGIALHPRDDADLAAVPVASAQAADLAALLARWPATSTEARRAAVRALAARLDDAMAATGIARAPAKRIEAAAPELPTLDLPAPRGGAEAVNTRALILHYHLFKNAGTSVDAMLKANFGDRWASQEFDSAPPKEKAARLTAFLEERADLDAFSSHTALLPAPSLPGRAVIPIIFVRHPLLRLRSAYAFERRQIADTKGAILAKQTDLPGYLEAMLADPKLRQARNFQASRFAFGTPGKPADELDRALATLARLPFVGLVEAYDESIARLVPLLTPHFPDFRAIAAHENVTDRAVDRSVDDRLAAMREEIGAALYDQLIEANQHDLALFAEVRARYSVF